MPSEKAHQLSCDIATSCTEIEDHCPVFRWNWKCKSCPMDFCFKLDEEFEHFNHAMQQTCKGTITCVSDCGKTAKFMGTFKYSGGSVWTQCMTITEHFMIMVSMYKQINFFFFSKFNEKCRKYLCTYIFFSYRNHNVLE